jgi:KaiC/GvpD/RAD55 family RecA-like ATPase
MEVLKLIERAKSGIPGLDGLIEGGFPRGDTLLLAGGTGCGKTIFSTQFVYNGAVQHGEKGLYATFEEEAKTLKRNILRFGFDFEELERKGMVRLIDLEALRGSGLSANIEFILSELKDLGGKRLVIDSLTAFLIACEEKFEYRTIMHVFYRRLKTLGCTTILTCSVPTGYGSLGLGIEEFVADSVITLENAIESKELKTKFLIRKMRGTNHSKRYHDAIITGEGIKIVPFTTS